MSVRVLSILGTALMAGVAAAATVETPEYQAVDAIVRRGIEEKSYPGAVLVIGQPGRLLWSKAYGRLTYDPGSPAMTLDTMFDLASVSKVVGTATAAMELLEEGKLGLDDRVSSSFPAFAAGGKQDVRIKDLLTHVSGLKAYESATKAEADRHPGESKADAMLRRIAGLTATAAPGTTMTYSCLNMQTMARVNETILGGRMDDYLRRKVYGPLGMTNTVYRLSADQKARCAPTSLLDDGTSNAASIHDPIANYHGVEDHCPGNAGVFSTGPDLARFCEMILTEGKVEGKQILKPETVRLMTSVQSPDTLRERRALGWDIYTRAPYCTRLNQSDEARVIGHTGYTGTLLWLDKKSRTYVVFLTNRTFPDDSKQSSRGVSQARREICGSVLHALPEYRAFFAGEGAKGEKATEE